MGTRPQKRESVVTNQPRAVRHFRASTSSPSNRKTSPATPGFPAVPHVVATPDNEGMHRGNTYPTRPGELGRMSLLRDVVQAWGESLDTRVRRGELKPSTAHNYRRDIVRSAPLFDFPVSRLRAGDVQHWLDRIEPLGKNGLPSASMAATALFLLRRCLAWARRRGLIDHNPAVDLSLKVRRTKGQALTLTQIGRLMRALDEVDVERQAFDLRRHMPQAYLDALRGPCLCVMLLLLTGARLSEVRLARVDEVDEERRRIVIPRGKNGERRVLILAPLAQQLVTEQIARAAALGSDHLFPSPQNPKRACSKTMVWNVFVRAKAKAGIPKRTVHDLRHSCATRLYQLEVPRDTIQGVLGHVNPRSTDHYLHESESPQVRRALELYEQQVRGARDG